MPTPRAHDAAPHQTGDDYAPQFCRVQDVSDVARSALLLLPALPLAPPREPRADHPRREPRPAWRPDWTALCHSRERGADPRTEFVSQLWSVQPAPGGKCHLYRAEHDCQYPEPSHGGESLEHRWDSAVGDSWGESVSAQSEWGAVWSECQPGHQRIVSCQYGQRATLQ